MPPLGQDFVLMRGNSTRPQRVGAAETTALPVPTYPGPTPVLPRAARGSGTGQEEWGWWNADAEAAGEGQEGSRGGGRGGVEEEQEKEWEEDLG